MNVFDVKRSSLAIVLMGMISLGLQMAGCAPEFHDNACKTNQDCFPDEVCTIEGVCRVKALNPDAGDASVDGGDTGQDAGVAQVASVEISPASADVGVGLTQQLEATAYDADHNAIDVALFDWTSADESIATVDSRGEVTAVALGTVEITARSVSQPDVSATAQINVVEGDVARIELSPDTATVVIGDTASFDVVAYNAADVEIGSPDVTWAVDDESIATVDDSGVVTGVAEGSVTLTATSVDDSQMTATASIDVTTVPVDHLQISPTDPSIAVGSATQLTVTVYDANDNELTDCTVTWSSDDETVATVDSTGIITGVAAGSATITAESEGKTATVDVTVTVPNTPPVASAGPDQTVVVGDTVTLDGRASHDNDANDTLTYAWTLNSAPSGSSATLSDTAVVQPTFTADVAGDYTLTLAVSDGIATQTDQVIITAQANTAPTADAGSNQTVALGAQVTLDASASADTDPGDSIASYAWAMDSKPTGSTAALSDATVAQPTFTADVAGDYVFTVTVTDTHNATASATVTVTANTAPTASATAPTTVIQGDTVTVDASASQDADGDALTYAWTVDTYPGTAAPTLSDATVAQPTFTADAVGDYTLTVTVTDTHNATDTATVTVTAQANTAPTADAGSNQTVTLGTQVTLDASASADADPGDSIASYAWVIDSKPASSTASLSDATVAQPMFTADVAGDYAFTVTVTDMHGATASATVTVTANTAPVASATAPTTVVQGDTVTVDASASQDADGDALTYAWTVDTYPGSAAPTLSDATVAQPTFTADAVGDYTLTVTVTDAHNATDTASVTITAQANTAPTADAGSSQTVTPGTQVTLDASASTDTDPGDSIASYAWTMDSKPSTSTAALSDATVAQPTFTADVAGDYAFTVTVTDMHGATASASVTVTANTAPVASATAPTAVVQGDTVTVDASASQDADGDALTYAWTVDAYPGTTAPTLSDATVAQPTFTADTVGDYTLTVTVTDAHNATDTATVTVTAQANTAPTASTGGDRTAGIGSVVTLDATGSSDSDPGDAIASYAWTMDSKPSTSTAALSDPTVAQPTFTADLGGSYVLTVTVTDMHGATNSATVTITAQ